MSRWLTPPLGYFTDPDCVLADPIGEPLDWASAAVVGFMDRHGTHVVSVRDYERWAA